MGREVEEKFKRGDICLSMVIHVEVWQKHHNIVIIFQ